MTKLIYILFLNFFFIIGCDNQPDSLKVETIVGQKESASLEVELAVQSIDPVSVNPGEKITLTGLGFDPSIAVQIDDIEVDVEFISSESIVVTMPEGNPGVRSLKIKYKDTEIIKSIMRKAIDGLAVIDATAEDHCEGYEFYNFSGKKITGVRNCDKIAEGLKCSQDGEKDCITIDTFPAANLSLLASSVSKEFTVMGVVGGVEFDYPDPSNVSSRDSVNTTSGTIPDCALNDGAGCISNNIFKSIDTAEIIPANFSNSLKLNETSGVMIDNLTDCTSSGGVDCKTTTAYPAIDVSLVEEGSGDNFSSDLNLLGVSGNLTKEAHSTCKTSGEIDCITDSDFISAEKAKITKANLATGYSLLLSPDTVSGEMIIESHSDCDETSETGCLSNDSYKAALGTSFVAGNILSGHKVDRATGTLTGTYNGETHTDCSDGADLVGCISNSSYIATDMSLIDSANIRDGITIAGIDGNVIGIDDCNSTTISGCLTSNAFPSYEASLLISKNILTNTTYNGISGTAIAEGEHLSCSNDGDGSGCLLEGNYKAADTSAFNGSNILKNIAGVASSLGSSCGGDGSYDCFLGDTASNIRAESKLVLKNYNIKQGITLGGVTGTFDGSSVLDCMFDAATGCKTTSEFPAVDMTAVVSNNIRSGVSLAGVNGSFTGEYNARITSPLDTKSPNHIVLGNSFNLEYDVDLAAAANVTFYVKKDSQSGCDATATLASKGWGAIVNISLGSGVSPQQTSIDTSASAFSGKGSYFVCIVISDSTNSFISYSLSPNPIHIFPSDWWHENWRYRREISFNSDPSEELSDVPVMVKLPAGDAAYTNVKSDGSDIRFVSSSGAVLPYEIESWDTSGESIIWVKIPSLTAGVNNPFYLYYGNANALDAQDSSAVWSNGYDAVWHLGDDVNDSGPNDIHAVNYGTTVKTGKVGKGREFNLDGSGALESSQKDTIFACCNLPVVNNAGQSEVMMSGWVKIKDVISGNLAAIMSIGRNNLIPTDGSRFSVHFNYNFTVRSFARSTDSSAGKGSNDKTISGQEGDIKDQWVYVNAGINLADDSFHFVFYLDHDDTPITVGDDFPDGTFDQNEFPTTTSKNLSLGTDDDGLERYFHGMMDEMRLSNVIRSNEWIKVQYKSMTGSLLSIGSEE